MGLVEINTEPKVNWGFQCCNSLWGLVNSKWKWIEQSSLVMWKVVLHTGTKSIKCSQLASVGKHKTLLSFYEQLQGKCAVYSFEHYVLAAVAFFNVPCISDVFKCIIPSDNAYHHICLLVIKESRCMSSLLSIKNARFNRTHVLTSEPFENP